jgi:programmed cell death 8 (apoptosis-inducing factor)
VSQIYAEVAPLAAHLPIYLAEHVQQRLRRVGVQPVAERLVTEVRSADESDPESSIQVSLVGWELEQMVTDYVVLASTHVDPMVRVAKESGFEIDPNNGGIVVNGFMEAASGVFAAGSCASYYDPALGRRRVDMLDHSVNSGLLAGYNMAVAKSKQQSWGRLQQRHNATEENSAPVGHTVEESAVEDHCAGGGWVADATRPAKKSLALGIGSNPRRYVHQPTFRSNLEGLDILVEGVGRVDSSLRTVGIWVGGKQHRAATMGGPDEANAVNTQFTRGIVYYLNGTQVAGILLWNAPDLVDKARDVIRLQPTISSIESLRTLLALAPNEWLSTIEVQQAPAGTPERQLT